MARLLRILLALAAFFVSVAVISACGGASGGTVAKIGDTSISKDTFDHWVGIAAKSSAQSTPGQPAVVPDPPDYTKCIAVAEKSTPKPAAGQPKPNPAQFKQQCQRTYDQLKMQVLPFLIQAEWIQGEAKDQGVSVTDADVQKQLALQKKQAFGTEAKFQQFLKTSGFTPDDVNFRVKISTLAMKLQAKVVKPAPVTDPQVSAYYNSHKQQFAKPEHRALEIVLAKTRARADAAKAALQKGASFKAVVKKYSVDQTTKATGGLLPNVFRGEQDRALDAASFSAPKGTLEGPVKGQFGFYVFRVKSITPPTQPAFPVVAPQIKQQLMAQAQQSAFTAFRTQFRKKWVARTQCQKAFLVDGCKGAPPPPPQPVTPGGAGGAGGAAPQGGGGAAPQGSGGAAPQGGGP